jgi:hypothetical protein
MITVLFVRKDSIYKKLGVDCWDIERDARLWQGGNPVIAHPPCRAWGQLAHLAKPRPDEKELAIWSIDQIRKNGGVLEHPRASKLWKHMNLPVGQMIDEYGGFSICVNQSWFGHSCEKKTMLYICGCSPSDLPSYPVSFDLVLFTVGTNKKTKDCNRKKECPKKHREATPLSFAQWLIEVANKCQLDNPTGY